MSVEATLVAKIIDLVNEIALDQIEQDIEANTKFALKSELINPVLLEEWIAFYNAYMGTSLNWQDYLDVSPTQLEQSFISFGNSYLGVS